MTEFDTVAEQHREMDGMPLVDYFSIGLPIYRLRLEALVIEKRNLMPLEEFMLKAIQAGTRTSEEAVGILGVSADYGAKVIESLCVNEYLGRRPELIIRPKGASALLEAGERRIYEKVLPYAWDPITGRTVKPTMNLIKGGTLKHDRIVRVVPPSTRLPPLTELAIDSQSTKQIHDNEQVIRYLAVQKRTLLFRPAILLLYGRGKGNEPFARVAIDGVIDAVSSEAFATKELLVRLGIDGLFNRRLGATAVDQRIKPLNLLPGKESWADLLTLRSTLQLMITSLEKRATEEAAVKLESKRIELAKVQQKLEEIPVRALLPFEMPQLFDIALEKAKREILITTTLPVGARLTPLRLLLLGQALKRKVKVRFLISDRPTEDEYAKQEGPVPLLRTLNEMMTVYPDLDVSFLRDTDRVVYEVKMDEAILGVANEPPLGLRNRDPLARHFSGYQISGSNSIKAYASRHLSTQALAVVDKIKIPIFGSKNLSR